MSGPGLRVRGAPALQLLVFLVSVLACAAPAMAQAPHGWATIPERETPGARLVHFPPRSGVERPAEVGSVKAVRTLNSIPEGVAAIEDRVYLLFDAGGARTVVSGRAVVSVGGVWTFDPAGRLRAHPKVPGAGAVLGFTGTDLGPAAIVTLAGEEDKGGDADTSSAENAGESSERELVAAETADARAALAVLEGDAWRAVDLPDTFDAGPGASAVSWQGRPGAIDAKGRVFALGAGDAWSMVASAPAAWVGADARIVSVGAGIVSVRRDDAGRVVSGLVTEGGRVELAPVEGVAEDFAVSALGGGSDALVVLWRVGERGFEIAEISAVTGRELYRGEPIQLVPVSAGEFRLLVTLLVMLMVAVIVIAVRPSGDGTAVLPRGAALAEPGRRFAATIIDLGIALLVVSWVFGVRVMQIASFQVLFEPGGWVTIPGVLIAGGLIGGVFEGIFGWSIGKLLMGCRVVRVSPTPGRAGIVRAMGRSLVKWMLPPVATLALVESDPRHRGDTMCGLAVVVPVDSAGDRGGRAEGQVGDRTDDRAAKGSDGGDDSGRTDDQG